MRVFHVESSHPFEEDPRHFGSILTHLLDLQVLRFLLHKRLVDCLQYLQAFNMIQPFGHFSTMSLSFGYHLFVFQTAFFKNSPLHVHENSHASLLLGSNFAFFTALINGLLTTHRLNQDLLLMTLRPFFSHIYIQLNMIVFITTALFH